MNGQGSQTRYVRVEMSDFDDEFLRDEEGDEGFGGFLRGLKPGHKVSVAGTFRYRQGGNPREWGDPGEAKYLPREWQMLAGAVAWTGTAATTGVVEVTFPAVFSGSPLTWVTPVLTNPLFQDVRCQAALQSNESIEIWWFAGASLTRVEFHWLAIGPIAIAM